MYTFLSILSLNKLLSKLELYFFTLVIKLDSFILKQQVVLETLVDTNFIYPNRQTELSGNILSSFVENTPSVNDIVIIDSFGAQKAYYGPYYKFDYKDILETLKQTTIKEKEIFFGGLKKNPILRKLIFTLALPLPNLVNGKDGALLAQIDMKPFEKEIAPLLTQEDNILIFTKSGFLIFSSQRGVSTEATNNHNTIIVHLLSLIKERNLPFTVEDKNGFISQNPSSLWYIYNSREIKENVSSALSFYKENWKIFALFVLIIFALSLMIALYIASSIEAPVRDMAKAVKIIEEDS